jgi:hypothetical protein
MIPTMTTPSRRQLRDWSAELTLDHLDPADPKETRYVPLDARACAYLNSAP